MSDKVVKLTIQFKNMVWNRVVEPPINTFVFLMIDPILSYHHNDYLSFVKSKTKGLLFIHQISEASLLSPLSMIKKKTIY